MRLAVLSDIHANLAALEAVLADLDAQGGVDGIWACGDTVGYGPQPNEVIARLAERGARAVLGNHDGAAIGTVDVSWFNDAAAAAIGWTRTVLNAASIDYLAALPERVEDGELTVVHGSPREPIWEYVVSPEVARDNLAAFKTRICLFGHTHYPVAYSAADGEVREADAPVGVAATLPEGRLLLNPGSVGQPRDRNPDSSYLVLDLDGGRIEFRRVAYDIGRTQELMRQARLPTWLVERLSHGR